MLNNRVNGPDIVQTIISNTLPRTFDIVCLEKAFHFWSVLGLQIKLERKKTRIFRKVYCLIVTIPHMCKASKPV